jgi:PAS domain S-box-containing protein
VVYACLEHPARWRLVSQITLVVVALVIPLEMIVLWSGVANLEERRAAELEHSVLVGQALAAVVDGFAGDLQSSTLSTAIALGSQPGQLDQPTAGPHLRAVAEQYPNVRAIFLTDPQGRLTATSADGEPGLDLSTRPYIPPLKSGAPTVWSGGMVGMETRETTVAFGRAVQDPGGTVRGFLIAAFYPRQFVQRLPIDLPPDARITVMDARGESLFDNKPPDARSGPAESAAFRRAANGEIVRITAHLDSVHGDARFGALVPIARLGWVVSYTLPSAPVEAALAQRSAFQAGGIAILILLAASAFLLIARRLTRPLTMLAGSADTIARGEQPAFQEVESAAEVRQLALAMRVMSGAVAEREADLRDSQQRLELALQAARMVAWEWDPRADRVTASANLTEVYGINAIEGGAHAFGMIHPDDLAAHQAAIDAAIASRGGYRSEFRVVRPDTGAIEWREERGLAVTDEHGELRKVHGVVMDITQRLVAESALRESESRLRLAVEAAPVVLFNHDRDLRYTWVGKPLAGAAPDSLIGKTDDELFTPAIAGPAVDLKRRALETEQRVEGEIDLPDGDGSDQLPARRWHLTAEPLRDASGTLVGITCAILDVTERRALERLQQEFISLVSHELRNPLASIKGYAQLLQRRSEYSERAMQSIVEQSDHLDRLISDLLDSSRVEAGRLALRRRRGSLTDVLASSVERIQAQTDRHAVRLELSDEPFVGVWDTQRLEQVFTNLLTNAVKYSPDGGEIVVRLERQGDEAHVMIQDQGVGIEADQLPHVFDRFYRVTATAPTTPGLGIGLYIARELVQSHGGQLWAESAGLGRGTTFHLTLPLNLTLAPTSADARPVLVVDDDDSLRSLIAHTLRDEGYELATASDGVEALDRIAAAPPSLILLDWMLPRLGGKEFADELRNRHPGLDVPILVMTAGGVAHERAVSIGATGYLSKPFELDLLVDQVAQHLGPHTTDPPPVN